MKNLRRVISNARLSLKEKELSQIISRQIKFLTLSLSELKKTPSAIKRVSRYSLQVKKSVSHKKQNNQPSKAASQSSGKNEKNQDDNNDIEDISRKIDFLQVKYGVPEFT